jgi:hypothetical protein
MKVLTSIGFRSGGRIALWLGQFAAIRAATERLRSATTEEERREAQAALERLKEQQADAEQNGDRWLF